MSPFTLRPYQQEAVDRALAFLTDESLRGRNGLIVAPTGSGKSLIVAGLATQLPGRCVVFQPSQEILQQNAAKLTVYGYAPAIWSASFGRKERGTITLATIGSVTRHEAEFQDVDFVLVDECHLVNAKGGMYASFLKAVGHARCLGLTATPYRLSSNSFGSTLRFLTRTRPRVFTDLVHCTQVPDLVRDGHLATLDYRVLDVLPKGRLRLNSTGADYTDESVQALFKEVDFRPRLVREVQQLLEEGWPSILVFVRFVEEAEKLAAAIPGATVVTGETPDRERARILQNFTSGRTRVVTNVGVLTTGFDFPSLSCVVLARPTVSLGLFYQMVGRCIRPHPSKPRGLVVDLVGTVPMFGRVEDLVIKGGGKKGDLWVVKSQGRDLTNVYFGQPDERQQKKAAYWAKHRGVRAIGRQHAVVRTRAGDGLF